MNTDLIYAYLFRATWFFLSGWVFFLMAACAVEFRRELSTKPVSR